MLFENQGKYTVQKDLSLVAFFLSFFFLEATRSGRDYGDNNIRNIRNLEFFSVLKVNLGNNTQELIQPIKVDSAQSITHLPRIGALQVFGLTASDISR